MANHVEIRDKLRAFATRADIYDLTENVLRELKGYGDELVPALVDSLNDPDDEVRLLVLRLFWEMGTDAEPALQALIKSLEDSNRNVRLCAAGILGRIGQKAKKATRILEKWIGAKDRFSHVTALGSIMLIDPTKADDLLPLLIDAIESDGMAQLEAIFWLEHLGEIAGDAILSLSLLLQDDNSCVRLAASDALFEITGDASVSIKVGLDLLDDARDWLQRFVGADQVHSDGRPQPFSWMCRRADASCSDRGQSWAAKPSSYL
jgi:HEAT repeat protein